MGSDDPSIGLFVELSIMSAPFMSIQFLYVAFNIPLRGIYLTEN
ncbi:hypothetical protein EDO6_06006 [Paenibacillus xylanexedens]|nr:hypothetical protein EDO6_06006 [Paenibacillus xylanexedens]